jgi:hypothetical protein
MANETEHQKAGDAKKDQPSQATDRQGDQQNQGGKSEKSQPQRDSDRDQRSAASKQRE